MRGIAVVKVGGNEVEDPRWVEKLAAAVAASTNPTVLVHGGGREITEIQRTLGAEPEWHEGLRITTPAALRAVSMVLSGVVNKRLVAGLVTAGVDALGLSGEDGGILRAKPALGGRLGRTGEIVEVQTRLLLMLLDNGVTPVLSPVSRGPDGGALNVNADDSAAAVAAALEAERFELVSNVPGVLVDGATQAEIDGDRLSQLIEGGIASGGMIPKLRAGMRAALAGVPEVRIGDLSLLTDRRAGTRLVAVSG